MVQAFRALGWTDFCKEWVVVGCGMIVCWNQSGLGLDNLLLRV